MKFWQNGQKIAPLKNTLDIALKQKIQFLWRWKKSGQLPKAQKNT